MNVLDEFVLRHIISFIDCESEIYKVNKFFSNEYKCRKVKLPLSDKYLCKIHGDKDYFYSEFYINKYLKKRNIKTIHFENQKQLSIAKPYLKRIGKISHYCCNNKGVMFITNDKKKNL